MHKHFHFTRCLKFDEVWYENWLLVFMLSVVVFFLADILCFLKFASVKRIVSVGIQHWNLHFSWFAEKRNPIQDKRERWHLKVA